MKDQRSSIVVSIFSFYASLEIIHGTFCTLSLFIILTFTQRSILFHSQILVVTGSRDGQPHLFLLTKLIIAPRAPRRGAERHITCTCLDVSAAAAQAAAVGVRYTQKTQPGREKLVQSTHETSCSN